MDLITQITQMGVKIALLRYFFVKNYYLSI